MLFRMINDDALRGEEHSCHRSGILQCHAGYLRRVNHTSLIQVLVLVRTGVVTEVCLAGTNLIHHYCTFFSGVGNNLTKRLLNRTAYDLDTRLLVLVDALEFVQRSLSTHRPRGLSSLSSPPRSLHRH